MAMKKKNAGVAKRVADRKAFVKDKAASKGLDKKEARKRFYVQTRVSEMKAKGKTVTPEMRKDLRMKFESGNVSRAGFAAPKRKSGGSKVKPNPRDGQSSNYPPGYKPPTTRAKTSSKVPREAAKPTGARDRNRRTS